MERQQCNSLQNFDEPKTEILKKRLLKSTSAPVTTNLSQNSSQHNVLLNTLRAPIPSSMIVSSVQAPQSSMPITHNLVTHSIAPMKIHTNNSPYPLQLSTVHVPVQIPGSTSNINVPVQLSGPTSTVPLQIAPVSLPLQVSGTTSVPVQLPAGETINVPLQIPAASQNIQLTGPALPSMPILQNANQSLHNSIIHVHMGSNPRPTNIDGTSDLTVSSSSQLQMPDSSGVQVKINNPTSVSQVHVGTNPAVVQIPNTTNNSIQLALPNTGNSGTVQLRGATRTVPHMVYIQTPTGLKAVTSTEVISQASTSGNPPQIIVRRPVTSNSNILISNMTSKPNIAPKVSNQNKSSILAPVNATQPIVIQKPKSNDKKMVPVSIAPGPQGKQAIAYLSSVKKPSSKNLTDNQSILISNNQSNVTPGNQKLFLTPMNMPKIQNTKFILPVTLPATAMASKGPFINLQIANGQIQNDPQGNITVMRDPAPMETTDIPPLQPLAKVVGANGKDNNNLVPESPKSEKAYAFSISGSRAEPTGEQGEYTLSIPETNASMNDDIYTVSIADDEGGQTREKSFTLAIPEKGKSLLNRNVLDRSEMGTVTIAAPAILRRSNSDNSERKTAHANIKRRISLCNENLSNKKINLSLPQQKVDKSDDRHDCDNNDDHRVPSLFCDEKLDKDLDAKVNLPDSDEEFKDVKTEPSSEKDNHSNHDILYYQKIDTFVKNESSFGAQKDKLDGTLEEGPPGLIWSNGVALLEGSTLQFQTNEFGLIDLIDNGDQEEVLANPSAKYHTPLKQRIERSVRDKKPTSPEDMYRCDGCGCHGMAADFINPNFCSSTCQNEVQKVLQKKKDKEKAEITKKKNKMKKLFMRKQLSDSDILQENKDDKIILKHYDSTPAENQGDVLKLNEDLIENEKYPWMCGKNGFSWMRYLDICKAKAAPVKLFKDPFPYQTRNGFKVGMRLEAIDPQHPSLFCVVSVGEVQGFRMRLHFDGYPDLHDYWVNSDSIDIFPPGWCEKNGRSLKPPANYSPTIFSWPLYLKQMRAIAAPKHLFPHMSNTIFKPNCFRIGMKLEAEDRKNDLVCVATITDMMDNRMLINFDSWDEMYDYWVDPTSPYIHPVGWAEENGISLTPPNFYKDPDQFSWENYLSETGASAAPPRAFKTRPPQGFKPGMKLEVVDSRVPFLIRVASISEVKGHQVRVSFDGWPDELSTWMDDDSPDIHPVGWCLKTGHPLEPPLTAEELSVVGPCGVGGCRGLGSVRGGAHKQHGAASACPYRARRPAHAQDRLAPHPQPADHALPRSRRVPIKIPKSIHTSTPTSETKDKPQRGRPPKHKRVEEVTKNDPVSDDESVSSGGWKRWRGSEPRGTERPLRTYSRASAPVQLRPSQQHQPARALLARHLADLDLPSDPTVWTQKDVVSLVSRIGGESAGSLAAKARLGGAELVMASCDELAAALRLRLGPAVKLHAAVRQLRDTLA
ncbi:lethal (3) malignant brain tumor [Aphomia sociella]